MIDRASVMVIELGSQWTNAEYRMAVARVRGTGADSPRRRRLELIIVVPSDEQLEPTDVREFPTIRRPNLISGDPEPFIAELANSLREIAAETGEGRTQEPRRLLNAKEHRAAVISAMTLLEATLRERLEKGPWTEVRGPMSLRKLIDHAVERQIIRPQSTQRIFSWIRARNEAVHTAKPVGRAQASEIVEGVLELLQQNQM